MPLPLILVGAVWALGWDWRLLVLVPLSLICTMSIGALRSFHQTGRVYEQISDLYGNHPHWRFTRITTADYLEALYQNSLTPTNESGAAREQEFAKSVLTSSEYYGGDHLRFVVIETEEKAAVGVLATFATLNRAWVFLDGNPRAMQGFEHFKVLHEVGHTSPAGIVIGYAMRGNLTQLLLMLPVIAFMLKWETTTLLLLTLYLLVVLSMTKYTFRWIGRHMRYIEEMYADDFALERCPRHWFESFSGQDVKDFAHAICGNWPPGGRQEHASLVYDAPMTEDQVKWRRIVLVNKLNLMLKGDEYVAEERVPVLSANLIQLLTLCQNTLLAALALALGLQHAELTTARFVALVVMMMLITIAGLVVVQLGQLLATHWDANLNAKPLFERSPTEQKFLASLDKGTRWREQFDAWRLRMQDEGLDNDVPAAGTTGRLFMPKEVDLRVNERTSESYIFHGKVIDYDISHLEYVSDGHSIVVVMNDRTRLDLGVKLRAEIRPHFLKADQVLIIRTENRKSVGGVTVPLLKDARAPKAEDGRGEPNAR